MLRKPKMSEHKEPSKRSSYETEVLDSVDNFLKENSITAFDKNNVVEEYLILPQFLTDVESRELGRFFHTFTQQKLWVRTVYSKMNALLMTYQAKLDDRKASLYANLPARMSVTEKELSLQRDKEAREILDEIVKLKIRVDILKNYLENLVDGIFDISREITRRGGDFDDDKRNDRIDKMRKGTR